MDNKLVLVTGGSRGIGAAACRLAAARGWDVAVNYARDSAAASAVVKDCRRAGVRSEAFQGDMAVESDISRVFREVDERMGRIDALVNNAGITGPASHLDAADAATIRAVIDLNVTGTIPATKEAVLRLSTRHGGPGGSIVNLSSAGAWLGSPKTYVWYAATKGAIDSFTIGLATELGREGVRVNAVAPGLIETDIHQTAGMPGRTDKLGPRMPIGRSGSPQEVAEVVLFLISPFASYVTGAIYRVTGGT